MSKQKTSFSITEQADNQLLELAERNGLSKSAVLEILVRQAHAANWAIVASPSAWVAAGKAETKVRDIRVDTRLHAQLSEFIHSHKTMADVAAYGMRGFLKHRGCGKKTLRAIEDLCAEYGCRLEPL